MFYETSFFFLLLFVQGSVTMLRRRKWGTITPQQSTGAADKETQKLSKCKKEGFLHFSFFLLIPGLG